MSGAREVTGLHARHDTVPDGPVYDPDQLIVGRRLALLERAREGLPVLDVGCWSGYAGRQLLARGAFALEGVEPDGAMARRAQAVYGHVWATGIEQALPELLAERRAHYGTILLLDVLEHLPEPQAVLEAAAPLLAPGGCILVSLPNVAHWSMRKELLLGRWRYREHGLLDRTHLRFFTLDSARELLESAGFRVTYSDVELDRPPLVDLPEPWLGHLRRWPRLFGVQSLFEATPQATDR